MEHVIKSECDEIKDKQEIFSIYIKSEVYTEATEDPISLDIDSVQIESQNIPIDPPEEYIAEYTVKSEYESNQEVSSNDIKSVYTENQNIDEEPTNEPSSISLVGLDPNPTCQINTQNINPSVSYNIYKAPSTLHRLNTPISCKIISEAFPEKNSEKEHSLMHTEKQLISSELCRRVDCELSNLKTHLREKFSCGVCTNSFSQKSILKTHLLGHKVKESYSSDVTSKALCQRGDVNTFSFAKEKSFSCDVCSKTFSRRGHLKVHQHTHTGEKQFSCGECTKAFTQRSHLKIHIRTHTGEKYFSCSICSKAFTQSSHLKTHLISHTGEKFSCNVCTKAFTGRSNLKRHMRIHTGQKSHSCDVCTKAFYRTSDLKTHLLTHTGEKSFSCDVCTKTFALKHNLKTHLLTHSGQKSFSCDICFKAFAQRRHLKKHQFTHT